MRACVLTFLFVLAEVASHAQGSLSYFNYTGGVGKGEKYVYKPDPVNPTVAKAGGALSDYAGFTKIEGTGYTAELWYALGPDLPEDSLRPVPGSQVGFRTGSTAGIINGKSKLDIVGTFGGDWVTLQLRVWNNEGGKISDWQQATERGKSRTFNHLLAGVAADGSPHLGTGSIVNGLTYFSLAVPEPSGVLLAGVTAGLFARSLKRRRKGTAELISQRHEAH
jgi:hypothetical protein